jgi:hypothetical protein
MEQFPKCPNEHCGGEVQLELDLTLTCREGDWQLPFSVMILAKARENAIEALEERFED